LAQNIKCIRRVVVVAALKPPETFLNAISRRNLSRCARLHEQSIQLVVAEVMRAKNVGHCGCDGVRNLILAGHNRDCMTRGCWPSNGKGGYHAPDDAGTKLAGRRVDVGATEACVGPWLRRQRLSFARVTTPHRTGGGGNARAQCGYRSVQ